MSPDHSVARGAASLLASRLSIAAIALAFLGVSTRLLTLEQMAAFAVYNTFCGLLTVVCSLGLLASCLKHVPAWRGRGEAARAAHLVRTAGRVYVAGAMVVTAAIIACRSTIAGVLLKDPSRDADVAIAAAAALCFGLYEAVQLLLSAHQRFARQARDNVVSALAQRLLSLGLFFPFGLTGYMAGFAAGSLMGAVSGWMELRQLLAGAADGKERSDSAAGHIAVAFPFYVDGYLRYAYMHADQLLVGIFLTPVDLSIYFVAKRFLQYGQVMVASLVEPLVARAAQVGEDLRRVGILYDRSLRWAVLAFVPLGILLAASSPFLLAVIGGERYAEGAPALALLMLSLPLFAIFAQQGAFVHALRPPRDRLLLNLSSSALQLAAMAALTPLWGLAGLAGSRLLGFSAGARAGRRLLAPHLAHAHPAPVLGRAMGQTLVPSAVAAGLVAAVHVGTGLPVATGAAAAAASILLGAWLLTGVLDPEDRAAVASMIPGGGAAARRVRGVVAGPARAGAPPI